MRPFANCLAILLTAAGCSGVFAGDIQSIASIRLQAESFVVKQSYDSPYPARIKLGKIDKRLRLEACSQALTIEFARQDKTSGNTALNISCPQSSSWKLLLPVSIDLFDDVFVTSSSLHKGQIIDEKSVRRAKHNISRLNNGYYSKAADLQNLEVKRNLKSGIVLSPANLQPELMVKSGQQVTLFLNYRGIHIKSSGKALQSARLGQIVRVRNNQSHKIVEGVVSGHGQVEVSI